MQWIKFDPLAAASTGRRPGKQQTENVKEVKDMTDSVVEEAMKALAAEQAAAAARAQTEESEQATEEHQQEQAQPDQAQKQEPREILESIETQLTEAVRSDQGVWQRCYELMHEVEEGKMYASAGYKSFTQWVNTMAARVGCHVSVLWARFKAGRTYSEYAARAQAAGREVPQLEQIKISPDTIKLCSTVAGADAATMDHLLDKSLAGELSRADLRAAARAKKAQNPEAEPETRHSAAADAAARAVQAGQPGQAEDGTADTDEQAEQAAQRRKHQQPELTAAQIVLALKQSKDWIGEPDTGKYVDRKCRHFTEFRADTGSSRAARRFDLLCIETLTAAERDTVVIRGVEIKVSKSDLEQDHKMQEYCAFCDAFYIAVPDVPEMIQTAEAVRLPAWGLLAITAAGALKIIHAAVLQPGLMRDKTIAAALIKLM